MSDRRVFATEFDLQRLRNLVRSTHLTAGGPDPALDDLLKALEQAVTVKTNEIPPDVVTMNSTIRLLDLDSGKKFIVTVVFPHQLGEEEDRASILSPLGSALFGFRQGDRVSVALPDGLRRYRILEVIYQPEASGRSSIDFAS